VRQKHPRWIFLLWKNSVLHVSVEGSDPIVILQEKENFSLPRFQNVFHRKPFAYLSGGAEGLSRLP